MVVWLFFAVPWIWLWIVTVVFPDHTHLLFLSHVLKMCGDQAYFSRLSVIL